MVLLKRFLIRYIYKLIQLRAFIFRPKSLGVRAMVFNKQGQVLLVKHSYRPEYFFPGGGVDKKESFAEACTRELWEETGLQVKKWNLFGTYRFFAEHKIDTIILMVSHDIVDEDDLKVDNVEIIEAGWYGVDDLPVGIHPSYVLRIQEYKEGRNPVVGTW
jgi:8-oxo-dGTP pyrophosphatase MutT (NUDIX family)